MVSSGCVRTLEAGHRLNPDDIGPIVAVSGEPIIVSGPLGPTPLGFRYRAKHEGQPLLVSVFDRELLGDPVTRRRLEAGLGVATTATHPRILGTHGFSLDGVIPFAVHADPRCTTVAEFVKRRLRKAKLPSLRTALRLVDQACEAFEYLHPNTTHGLLSGQTTFVDAQGKLTVFGLGEGGAAWRSDRFREQVSKGVLPRPGDEVDLSREPTVASDVYLLAAFMVEIVSGQVYQDPRQLDALRTTFARDGVDLLRQALAPKSSARPNSVSALRSGLQAALAATPARARGSSMSRVSHASTLTTLSNVSSISHMAPGPRPAGPRGAVGAMGQQQQMQAPAGPPRGYGQQGHHPQAPGNGAYSPVPNTGPFTAVPNTGPFTAVPNTSPHPQVPPGYMQGGHTPNNNFQRPMPAAALRSPSALPDQGATPVTRPGSETGELNLGLGLGNIDELANRLESIDGGASGTSDYLLGGGIDNATTMRTGASSTNDDEPLSDDEFALLLTTQPAGEATFLHVKDGVERGPFSAKQLLTMANRGELTSVDELVYRKHDRSFLAATHPALRPIFLKQNAAKELIARDAAKAVQEVREHNAHSRQTAMWVMVIVLLFAAAAAYVLAT